MFESNALAWDLFTANCCTRRKIAHFRYRFCTTRYLLTSQFQFFSTTSHKLKNQRLSDITGSLFRSVVFQASSPQVSLILGVNSLAHTVRTNFSAETWTLDENGRGPGSSRVGRGVSLLAARRGHVRWRARVTWRCCPGGVREYTGPRSISCQLIEETAPVLAGLEIESVLSARMDLTCDTVSVLLVSLLLLRRWRVGRSSLWSQFLVLSVGR